MTARRREAGEPRIGGGDGLQAAALGEIGGVKQSVKIPVLIGSGVTATNLSSYAETSDALIIGSDVKVDGKWQNQLDKERCKRIVEAGRNYR